MNNFQIINKLGKFTQFRRSNDFCLGEGAFSIVYKARRLTDNKEYALKKVSQ